MNDRVVGFLSFMPDFRHDAVPELGPSMLIDTIAVLPSWRRRGVGRALYRTVFATPHMERAEDVVLHTWSTNVQHGQLIDELGFKEIRRIPNERAPGVDTLIFKRPANRNGGPDEI